MSVTSPVSRSALAEGAAAAESSPSADQPTRRRPGRRRHAYRERAAYGFILPFFIIFGGFLLFPIVYSLVLSFSKWTAGKATFIGLTNYKQLFMDELFWKSLGNTALFLIIQVPIMLFLATVIAAVLNAKTTRFKGTLRTLFFLPALVDLVTYSIIFSMLFNEANGAINGFLGWFGADGVAWKTDPTWAKVMIIIVITWRWLGYNAIILLAGLQSVPGELYEAADIDGANAVQKFRRITIPMLKPILLFCTLLSTIGTLQLFAEPYILTGGGPNHATATVMLYLYDKGFGSFNFGLASAGAYIVTTLIGILAYVQVKVTRGGEI